MISLHVSLGIFFAGLILFIFTCYLLRDREPNNWSYLTTFVLPIISLPLATVGVSSVAERSLSPLVTFLCALPVVFLSTLLVCGVVEELGWWREDKLRQRRLKTEEATRLESNKRHMSKANALQTAEQWARQAEALDQRLTGALQAFAERLEEEAAHQRALYGPPDTVRPLPDQASNILYD